MFFTVSAVYFVSEFFRQLEYQIFTLPDCRPKSKIDGMTSIKYRLKAVRVLSLVLINIGVTGQREGREERRERGGGRGEGRGRRGRGEYAGGGREGERGGGEEGRERERERGAGRREGERERGGEEEGRRGGRGRGEEGGNPWTASLTRVPVTIKMFQQI